MNKPKNIHINVKNNCHSDGTNHLMSHKCLMPSKKGSHTSDKHPTGVDIQKPQTALQNDKITRESLYPDICPPLEEDLKNTLGVSTARAPFYAGEKDTSNDKELYEAFIQFCNAFKHLYKLIHTPDDVHSTASKIAYKGCTGRLMIIDNQTNFVIEPDVPYEISILQNPVIESGKLLHTLTNTHTYNKKGSNRKGLNHPPLNEGQTSSFKSSCPNEAVSSSQTPKPRRRLRKG